MIPRTTLTLVCAILALAAGWSAWADFQATRAAHTSLTTALRQQASMDRALDAATQRESFLARRRTALQEQVNRLRATQPATAGLPVAITPEAASWQKIYLDPKLQSLELQRFRSHLALTYGPLFHRLGLSASAIAQLEDLLVARHAYQVDISTSATVLGLTGSNPEIDALLARNQSQLETDEAEVLGPEAFRQLQLYDQTRHEREIVGNFAEDLVFSSAPLSADQAGRLVQLLQSTRTPAPSTSPAKTGGIDWTEAEKRAADFLSPPQLAEFSSTVSNARYRELQQQVMDMIRAWEKELPASSPLPTSAR